MHNIRTLKLQSAIIHVIINQLFVLPCVIYSVKRPDFVIVL